MDMSPNFFKAGTAREVKSGDVTFPSYLIRDANAAAGIIESAYSLCWEHGAIRLVAVGGDAR
jgi:hypothetical protein